MATERDQSLCTHSPRHLKTFGVSLASADPAGSLHPVVSTKAASSGSFLALTIHRNIAGGHGEGRGQPGGGTCPCRVSFLWMRCV